MDTLADLPPMHLDLYDREARIFEKENREMCTMCNHRFTTGDSTHLGYDNKNCFAYVCEKCSHFLSLTIVRHIYSKEIYESPHKHAKLWRYLDLAKFISLLQTKSLFFARADNFEDPFECAKGYRRAEPKWDAYYAGFFNGAISSAEKLQGWNNVLSEEEKHEEAFRLLKTLKDISMKDRQNTFICCWHENEYESEAMWKLYTSNLSQGIAIQTTYERLYNSLHRDPNIDIGRVNYVDFENHLCGPNGAWWFKRKSFEHEREVRAVIKKQSKNSIESIKCPIDIDILIENIYVSPTAPHWYWDLVIDVASKYGVEKGINCSSLSEEPFY